MSESIVAVEFGGRKVRTDSEGRVSVLDALAAVGVKNVSRAWKRTQTDNPELLSLATFIQAGPGRPTAFMTEDGIKQLLMTVQTRYLTASGKKLVTTFRAWLADLDTRFHAGDVTLAADIIDRQTDPAKLEWVARRAENKGAALSLNAGIQRHGGSQRVYSKVHDTLNVAVTGMTAYPAPDPALATRTQSHMRAWAQQQRDAYAAALADLQSRGVVKLQCPKCGFKHGLGMVGRSCNAASLNDPFTACDSTARLIEVLPVLSLSNGLGGVAEVRYTRDGGRGL